MRQPWRAFDRAWFGRLQVVLLALLAEPLIGRWLRWVLCIRPHDVGYRQRIVQLLPNAYVVANADGTYTADFRTHPKYAKRIYYAFRPLWWTLHAWDWAVADRWLPALSAGLNTLGPVFPDPGDPGITSVDGAPGRIGVNESWATIIAGAGNDTNRHASDNVIDIIASTISNQWTQMYRFVMTFDTSGLTGPVTAATLSLVFNDKGDTLSAAPTIDVYAATPASNTAIVNGDFNQIGSVSQTGAPLAFASVAIDDVTYTDFPFNGTGLGNIVSGISKFGLRNANYDAAASSPPWVSSGRSYFAADTADQTGTSKDPKLVVTYTPPARFILHN